PLASVTARLTVPDSTCVITTSAPATDCPLPSVTTPPTPADVLWAKTGAAASAAIRPIDSFESRRQLRLVMWGASMGGRGIPDGPVQRVAGGAPWECDRAGRRGRGLTSDEYDIGCR